MTATLPDAGLEHALGTVHNAMTGDVLVLAADTPADVAVRRLERAGVSGAPVVKGRRVVGMVTLRDLLTPLQLVGPTRTSGPFLRHEHLLAGFRVGDVMTDEPVVVGVDWALARAVTAMQQAGVNRVPAVDGLGQPVGILTRDDVLRVLADRLRPAATTIRQSARGARMAPD